MADDFKRLPLKLEQGEQLNPSNPWQIYCDSCKWRGTDHCGKRKRVLVQGAFPWDCIFCRSCKSKYSTFDFCPLRSVSESKEAHHGCPKLGKDERGEFCVFAVRSIELHHSDRAFVRFCDQYKFDEFAADSVCLQYSSYGYGMNFALVRRIVNERGWLTVEDMLNNIRLKDLQDAAKRGNTTVKLAWRALCECADVFGRYCDSDDMRFRQRTHEEQTRHVRRICAYDDYLKGRYYEKVKEERKAQRKKESEVGK